MKLNADFDQRAVVHADRMAWVASPVAGVSRRMLDRIGGEVARATSIVRYDPGSRFSPHVHNGGEEFIVLEGTFQDEHGDFPPGTYVRNPPQSRHTPASKPGCVIFVKLWQFDLADRQHVHIDTNALELAPDPGRPGIHALELFEDRRETVKLESWIPGSEITLAHDGGTELLVLEGSFEAAGENFRTHSWLRLPRGERLPARSGSAGARVWVKTGHLRYVEAPRVT
ncbi:MAG: cupin domain-containing protein [Gammaproteobacteria bacterium]